MVLFKNGAPLFGHLQVGPITPISTKDGRQAQKVDVTVCDQSHLGFTVTLWDEELIHVSHLWKAKETVLYIADARVRLSNMFGLTASADGRTVITVNPGDESKCRPSVEVTPDRVFCLPEDMPEAVALFDYIQGVDVDEDIGEEAYVDTTVYTVSQVNREIASRVQSGNVTPLSGILFAFLNQFDLDGPGLRLVASRCGHCNFRLRAGEPVCTNGTCPVAMGEAGAQCVEELDIPVMWTDHTGSLERSRISGRIAEGLIGMTVQQFKDLPENDLTSLKWNFLLERFKVQFKVYIADFKHRLWRRPLCPSPPSFFFPVEMNTRYFFRLPCLEQLTCSSTCDSDGALVSAVSELLRTTTCLTALNFSACFDYSQPPKTFMDALAANSTLEFLELCAHWTTAEPPGVLGEYVRSNRLLSRLTVSGHEVDREDLLLAECLVLNSTLSTLYIRNVCGGKTTVRFLTMILEGCASVRSLHIGLSRDKDAAIPEDTMGRCAEAMAANGTLKWLTLPYSLWNAKNWIAFLALLPRNKHLERLEISHSYHTEDYASFPSVLETVAHTGSAARVSFGYCPHGSGVNLMHFRVFSSIDICGEDNVKIDALQQLRAFAHFTSLTIDVSEAGERLLFSLAEYIRETTLLRELRLCLTSPQRPSNIAPSTCWMTLFDSILVNGSISRLGIFSNGNFQHNGRTAQAHWRKFQGTQGYSERWPRKKGIPADQMARMVRSRLRSVEGLHDFMRLTGVVKERVTCIPPADGCSMQLQDLNSDCWDLVKRRLSFDDVKRFTVAKPESSTSC
ncbi:hypothetical protein HPB50_001746 [Hyalomma asiaticum]|uniref:Uncharacterized protein n=1 Tax=Hyalomma asiaticum TaxID=266040 RepID=A0ACB7T7B9_HYAAI|nr:hypothetical protein HPB50_001746 [Hyalomma asiaticum]